ncbi:MAG: hypothetical protein CSYNP_03061 [Syntrophus sp. SKADARSKE-3]|nr:hypothetical protein [Syntrophus sp. SKADARSKE-3]
MANIFIFLTEDETIRTSYCIATPESHELETFLLLIQEKIQDEYLKQSYSNGICHLWGAQENEDNFSTWNLMDEGDLVLGWNNRLIVSASHVLMKVNHPLLATRIWNNKAEKPFALICFMNEPHTGEVPIVSQMSRYLDQDYSGFTKLSSEKRDNIINDYGSIEGFVKLCLGYDFPFSLRHSE